MVFQRETARRPLAVPGFDEDAERSVGFLLRKATRGVVDDFKVRLQTLGLSLQQGYVLLDLWREDGLHQRDLANRVGSQENAMVATVDALEAASLVVRTRGKADRRKTHIYLSAEGQRVCDDVLMSARETALTAFRGVSVEDSATALRVLKAIIDNFEAKPGASEGENT
jgi:MarR family transcriptional regulator for hemolysin